MSLCPCGSGTDVEVCCGPLLAGSPAPTAESLMRSRYTAYTLGRLDYLDRTIAPESRDRATSTDMANSLPSITWQGLEILRVTGGTAEDSTGEVDFRFHYRHHGEDFTQREIASFVKRDGGWLYQDSIVNPKEPPAHSTKVGRNDPCSCGSGKKYKKCCGTL